MFRCTQTRVRSKTVITIENQATKSLYKSLGSGIDEDEEGYVYFGEPIWIHAR